MANISKITTSQLNKIEGKSVLSLPDSPTSANYSAEQIKNAIVKPVTDASDSIVSEINRIVDEVNNNLVQKDGTKVLTDENYTSDEKTKLFGVETGAEVNIIETVKVEGTELTPTNKAVDITVADLGAVPNTRKINNQALSNDIILTLDNVADGTNKLPKTVVLTYSSANGNLKVATKDISGNEISSSTVNLPTESVISSGEVKTVETANTPVSGYLVGDKYIDFTLVGGNHLYIKVTDLVDQVLVSSVGSGNAVTDVSISGTDLTVTKGTVIDTAGDGLVKEGTTLALKTAGASMLGGVKVGNGLTINASGVLSATGIESTIDSEILDSVNPVQNGVIKTALDSKQDKLSAEKTTVADSFSKRVSAGYNNEVSDNSTAEVKSIKGNSTVVNETIVDSVVQGIKSVGSNLFCGSSQYVSVWPNTAYKVNHAETVYFYDSDKTELSNSTVTANTAFTTPANCAYLKISTSYALKLYFDGADSTYSEYWSDILTLPEAVTLRSVGSVKDEIDFVRQKKVTRVGTYTFTGNETWYVDTASGGVYIYYCNNVATEKKAGIPNLICNKYATNQTQYVGTMPNNSVSGYGSTSAADRIYVRNDSITTIAEIKSNMIGAIINYELETPIEDNIVMPDNQYRVDNWGTETVLSDTSPETVTTVAVELTAEYAKDIGGQVATNTENIEDLQIALGNIALTELSQFEDMTLSDTELYFAHTPGSSSTITLSFSGNTIIRSVTATTNKPLFGMGSSVSVSFTPSLSANTASVVVVYDGTATSAKPDVELTITATDIFGKSISKTATISIT